MGSKPLLGVILSSRVSNRRRTRLPFWRLTFACFRMNSFFRVRNMRGSRIKGEERICQRGRTFPVTSRRSRKMLQAQMWAQTDGNRAWWERPEALDEGDKLVGYSLLIHRDGFSYMLFVEPQADGILVDAQFGRPIPSSSKIPTALMDRIRDTNNKLPSHIVFAFRKCGPEVMELVLATKV